MKNNRIFKTGMFYLLLIVLSLTVAILANLVMAALPARITQQNMNEAGILELSSETNVFLGAMQQDSTVYWIVQPGREDNYIQRLLDKCEEQTPRLTVELVDPVQQPRFASQYTNELVTQNSLIVVSGTRSRYIGYADIYLQQETSGNSVSAATFCGEGELLSALHYVTSMQDVTIYTLTGHGETPIPAGILNALTAQNYTLKDLDLAAAGSVPADCALVLANGVTTDLPTAEAKILAEYLNGGGSLLLFSTWLDSTTPNWNTIVDAYGMSVQEAIIVEGQTDNHVSGYPYYILPSIASHAITQPLSLTGLRVLAPLSQALTIREDLPEGLTVQPLLKTSTAAYGKTAGFAMQTTEREDSDLRGPFLLGAVSERNTGTAQSTMIWFPSGYILDDTIDSTVSGGNTQLLIGAIQHLSGSTGDVTIPGKTLGGGKLLVNTTEKAILSVVMIALLPLGIMAAGIITVRRRKRR